MYSQTPFSMNESLGQHYTTTTLPLPRPSSSFEIMFLSDNSSLTLQSHIFWYRLLRPLTLPYPPPAPLYLSCWWTGDSTDFWGCFLETTLPQFSKPLSSHYLKNSGEHIMGPMMQWREQFKPTRRIVTHPHMLELTPTPHIQFGPPLLLNPSPPLILWSIHLPRWPDGPIPSLINWGLLRMLGQHGPRPFYLHLGQAILTKRPTSSQ